MQVHEHTRVALRKGVNGFDQWCLTMGLYVIGNIQVKGAAEHATGLVDLLAEVLQTDKEFAGCLQHLAPFIRKGKATAAAQADGQAQTGFQRGNIQTDRRFAFAQRNFGRTEAPCSATV